MFCIYNFTPGQPSTPTHLHVKVVHGRALPVEVDAGEVEAIDHPAIIHRHAHLVGRVGGDIKSVFLVVLRGDEARPSNALEQVSLHLGDGQIHDVSVVVTELELRSVSGGESRMVSMPTPELDAAAP